MSAETVISFFFASLALTIAPGPDVLYVLSTSVTQGKKHGIAAALGLSSGLLFHSTLLAFGISTLIVKNPTIYKSIKYFGALYLFWLAITVFKSKSSIQLQVQTKNSTRIWKKSIQGLIMNALNPKVMLFFLALFPTFIHTKATNIKTQVYILGFITFAQALVVFSLYAILSSRLTKFFRENTYFNTLLKWIQITIFITLAIIMLN